MDVYHQLSSYMKELGLQINSEQLAKFVTVAMRKQQDPVEFLAEVMSFILEEKRHRSYDMLLKLSGMPAEKTLESFDFPFQPNRKRPINPSPYSC